MQPYFIQQKTIMVVSSSVTIKNLELDHKLCGLNPIQNSARWKAATDSMFDRVDEHKDTVDASLSLTFLLVKIKPPWKFPRLWNLQMNWGCIQILSSDLNELEFLERYNFSILVGDAFRTISQSAPSSPSTCSTLAIGFLCLGIDYQWWFGVPTCKK